MFKLNLQKVAEITLERMKSCTISYPVPARLHANGQDLHHCNPNKLSYPVPARLHANGQDLHHGNPNKLCGPQFLTCIVIKNINFVLPIFT